MFTLSQIMIILLIFIAGFVSYRQFRYGDRKTGWTWIFIVAYWVVLTLKNMCDLFKW